jgi:hypothetical protein
MKELKIWVPQLDAGSDVTIMKRSYAERLGLEILQLIEKMEVSIQRYVCSIRIISIRITLSVHQY